MSDSENELGIEDFLPGGGSESETEIEEQTSMSTSPDDKSGDEAKPKITEKVEVEETDKKSNQEDGSSGFRKFINLSYIRSLSNFQRFGVAFVILIIFLGGCGVSFTVFLSQKYASLFYLFVMAALLPPRIIGVFWTSNRTALK